MERRSIAQVFDSCRAEGRAALIGFLAAGDPDFEATLRIARGALRGGVDILELGVPFSDPLADGPIIQAAYTRALAAGVTPRGVLRLVGDLRENADAPIVLMSAANPVLAYGVDRFTQDAAANGANGLLVPDLLPEDAGDFRQAAGRCGLDAIFLAAPGISTPRLAQAAAAAGGFLYLVSRRGVTGPDGGIGDTLEVEVNRARAAGAERVAVGFGVTTEDDVRRVAASADGVIVGSALVQAAHEAYAGAVAHGAGHRDAVREAARQVEAITTVLARGLHRADHLAEEVRT
jgi:tryptophan synthase alpha chain